METLEIETLDESVHEEVEAGGEQTGVQVDQEPAESGNEEPGTVELDTAVQESADTGGEVEFSLKDEIAKLRAELDALKASKPPAPPAGAARNTNRVYVLLTKELPSWGKVPRQQADMAQILASNFEVGKPVPEAELFAALERERQAYESLRISKQPTSALFRYYRGLKPEKNHAGYIARNFLRTFEAEPAKSAA